MFYTPDRELNPPESPDRCEDCNELINVRYAYVVDYDYYCDNCYKNLDET